MSETKTTTSNAVMIGCKIPNGLVLQVGSQRFVLKGTNVKPGAPHVVTGGYGLTTIPADVWAEWSGKHKDSVFIKNSIVFMQTTATKAEGQAKEQEGVKTGLEPLDPAKPAPGVKPVEA
ncbi:MAG: hypothetical protein ABF932_13665 [Gluconobacter potus]|uniref:Uncharacterized protein n=1 Tax=Gluconobacter potus TaxID=2724927 RepID=A0ABR9YNI0_9PROT|nr:MULTISPECIES: hypothetical protein [Gluconobacter]MBF0865113.1 hypothetical protein [Gluconobacter sp. R71656]MBF0868378.1 hypothetical protein [Gluconobacter sp. R75628]MBF0874251.1 hypothetical protein [Gluconobacter sp. R75629]MBF0883351.1 hypothetical protein [Gluconobacter potus]